MRAAEIRKCIDQTRTNATYTPEVKRHITEALVSELRRAAAEHLGSGGGGATPTSSATAASPVARRRDARDALSAAAATPIDESPSWLWSAARTANGSFAPANSSRVVAAGEKVVEGGGGAEEPYVAAAPPREVPPPHASPAKVAADQPRVGQLMNHVAHLRNQLADAQQKGLHAEKRATRLKNEHEDAHSRIKGHVNDHATLHAAHTDLATRHADVASELARASDALERASSRMQLLTRQREAALASVAAMERKLETETNEKLVAQRSIKMLQDRANERDRDNTPATALTAYAPILLPIPEPSSVPLLLEEMAAVEKRCAQTVAHATRERDTTRADMETLREILSSTNDMLTASETQRSMWQARAAAIEVAAANAHEAQAAHFLADIESTASGVAAASEESVLNAVIEEDALTGEMKLRVVSSDKTQRATSAMLRAAELTQATTPDETATVRAQLGLAWKGLFQLVARYEAMRAKHSESDLPRLDYESEAIELKSELTDLSAKLDNAKARIAGECSCHHLLWE